MLGMREKIHTASTDADSEISSVTVIHYRAPRGKSSNVYLEKLAGISILQRLEKRRTCFQRSLAGHVSARLLFT